MGSNSRAIFAEVSVFCKVHYPKAVSSNFSGESVVEEPVVEKIVIDPLAACAAEPVGALDKRNSRDNLSSHAGSPDASSAGNEPLEDVMDWESTAREMSADTLKSTHTQSRREHGTGLDQEAQGW